MILSRRAMLTKTISKKKKKNNTNNSAVIKYEFALRKRLNEESFTFSNFTPHLKFI
jgi:hypothetical protein